jgi:hypothetical protein
VKCPEIFEINPCGKNQKTYGALLMENSEDIDPLIKE